MNKILGINCSPKVETAVSELIGGKGHIEYERFHDGIVLDGYHMIILEIGRKQEQVIQQIRKLRYASNFQNIPIILIHGRKKNFSSQPYMIAGATEILSLHDPSAACRQILNGHLIPSREPLEEEFDYLNPFIKKYLPYPSNDGVG